MTRQRSRRSHGECSPQTALPLLVLLSFAATNASAQQVAKPDGSSASETPTGQDFALRGQRAARDIRYSDWHKVCFKAPGTNMVCRTSINGKFATGQSAIRIGLIEREGDMAARLQMFLPVGLYLQAGVKITIDQGAAHRFPYVWCRRGRSKTDSGNGDGQDARARGRRYKRAGGKHGSTDRSVCRRSTRRCSADVRAEYR